MVKQELGSKPPFSRFLLIVPMAVFFGLLGTPFMRILRNVFGPWKYWISGLIITAALMFSGAAFVFWGFLILSFWITVGVYQELEERGHANFWTACLSILLGGAVLILGPYFLVQAFGLNLGEALKISFEKFVFPFSGGKGFKDFGISEEALISQIPSFVILIETWALAFSLMLDRRLAVLFRFRYEKIATQMRLLEFRIPEMMIWVVMLSFLLSFFDGVPKPVAIVAANAFNSLMGFYFFQGLAVMEMSFLVFRIGPLIRLLIYFFVVGQLFFLLSVVGVIDYWVDIRQRLKRWKLSEKPPEQRG